MTYVDAVRVGCRKPKRIEITSLNPGDRLLVGPFTVRVDSVEWLEEEGFWRVHADAGWEIVHVMEDGTTLEMP